MIKVRPRIKSRYITDIYVVLSNQNMPDFSIIFVRLCCVASRMGMLVEVSEMCKYWTFSSISDDTYIYATSEIAKNRLIDVDYIDICPENAWSVSNRGRSEGICYLHSKRDMFPNDSPETIEISGWSLFLFELPIKITMCGKHRKCMNNFP